MRKLHASQLCSKALFLFFAVMLSAGRLHAQTDLSIGTGTTGNASTGYPSPLADYYEGTRAQYLYKASEMTAAGMTAGNITGIKFNVTAPGSTSVIEQYSIKILSTSVSSLTTAWETGATTVYGPVNYQPVAGLNTFTFTTPFYWDGSSNIIIEVCSGDPNNASAVTGSANASVPWTTGLSFNGSHTYVGDNAGNLCATTNTTNTGTQTTRPNITFSIILPPCSGTPAGGTAASTASGVCNTTTGFTLSVTGATYAGNITYQWEQSTDGGANWSDITGATSDSYTVSGINVNTSYRRKITCGTFSSFSTVVSVSNAPNYATLPFTESFEATWSSICGTREVPNNYWRNSPVTGNNSWRRHDDYTAAWSNNSGLYSPVASDGSFSARFHSYSASSGTKGQLNLYLNCNTPVSNKRLTFDFINTSGSDSLVVYLSTNGGTSFTRLDSVRTSTVWKTKTINFTSTSATTVLRFEATSDFGTTDIGLDNLMVIDYPACSGAPAGGTTTASATTVCAFVPFSLGVSGSPLASGLTFQWEQSTDGGATWTPISGATAENYTSPGIASNMSFRRQTTCSGNSSASAAVAVTVNAATYAALPFAESFEATWSSICGTREAPNTYWRNNPLSGNNSWRRNDDYTGGGWTSNSGTYTPAFSDGTYSARFHSYNASSGTKGQLNLYLNCNTPVTNKRITFDYINTSGSDSLVVYLSTNGGASFTRLDSVRTTSVWKTKIINFTSTSATTILRFEATSDAGSTDIGLDNIKVFDAPPPCTGTPAGGTIFTPTTTVCAGTPFTLSVNGATDLFSTSGLSVQWQQSTDGVAWTNIAGATADTYTSAGITANTSFRRQITCSGTTSSSTVVTMTLNVTYAPLPYTESFESDWINGCGTKDVPNTYWRNTPVTGNNSWRRNDDYLAGAWSGNSGAYTPAASDGSFSARFHSYNASSGTKGQFSLYVNCNTGSVGKKLSFDYINTSGTDSLVISLSTDGGVTFTRLDSVKTSTVWKTKIITFGSSSATTVLRFEATSDFGTSDIGLDNISLSSFADCTGTPVGGAAASSATNVCLSTPFTLSVNGATDITSAYGLNVQWQQSTDGVNWTNIAGATADTYTSIGIIVNTSYRRQITCGANSSTSSAVLVSVISPTYATLPFTESFEATWSSICDTRDVPNNYWRNSPVTGNNSWRRDDDGAAAAWTSTAGTYTPAGSIGTHSARFHSYNATSGSKGKFDFYVNCNTGTTGKKLKFDYINTSGADSLVVLFSTDGGVTFTRLDSVLTSTVWKTKTLSFPSTSATTVLRFEATSDDGTSDIGLDNISLVNFADCSGTPAGGTVTSTLSSGCPSTPFSLSVMGATDAYGITYQWQQSTDGGTTWTNISGATAETYTSAGITSNTSFRRQTNCGTNNSASTEVAVSVIDPTYATLPFTESFEATWSSICDTRDVPNNYWRNSPVTGNNSWRRDDDGAAAAWTAPTGAAYTPAASAGLHSARFHSYFASSGSKGQFNLYVNAATASATKKLSFDYINISGTDSLVVYLSTNGGTSFTRLDSVKLSTVWKTKTIVLNSTSATTVLRFEATSDYGGSDIGLDNIKLIDFPNCTGAPAGGTTVSTSSFVCPSTPFTVSVTGATEANGITYQWQQSTDGGTTWTNISGATAEAYTSTGITVATSYQRKTICGTNSSPSAPVSVTLNNPTYAVLPYAESFENNWSSGCGLRDIPNNSWRNNPVTGNNSWRRVDDGDAAAWTSPTLGDYNPDASDGQYSARFHSYYASSGSKGQFNLYLNANTTSQNKRLSFDFINTSGSDSLVVYLSTDAGATFTRLDSVLTSTVWRTKSIDFNSVSATTVIRFEATSDYGTTDIGLDNILITDFAPCAAMPAAGTARSDKSVVCGDPFTLSLLGSSSAAGITYQWQRSTDGVNYTDIAGATNFTLTTTQVATTWYRALETCTLTNESATSGSVQVISPTLVSGTFDINNALPTNAANRTFASFNDAYNYIKCGINGPVVFNVIDNSATVGVYNEQLIMTPVPGASKVNTVTFKGNRSTLAFNSTNTNERAVIKLRGADHIIFDSLVINAGAGTYGYGVQLISNADSNVVSHCVINTNTTATGQEYGGIVINASETGVIATGTVLCDGNTFNDNTINGGYVGISLAATAAGANGNNRFIHNAIKDFYTYGMYVAGSYNTLIEGNTFSRPTRSTVTDFYGIYFVSVSTSASISKNYITNPFGGALSSTSAFYGIYFSNTDATTDHENIVSNNVIGNINGEGAQTGIYNTGSDNVWYFHNTISLDSLASASTSTTRGFYQTTTAGGILFFDNMVTISRSGAGTKHAIYLNTNTTGFTADFNNYYLNSGAGTNVLGYFNSNQATLLDWQLATSQDANSFTRNPFYADVSAGNYKPTNGALDNKGTYAYIDTDILDQTRSTTTPDIGAYEFTGMACTLPPDPGNTVFSDTIVCQNSPVRLGLTLTSWGSAQTFQWQTAASAAGPWTDFAGLRDDPDTTIMASTTLYYRVGVSCGGTTVYSNPVQMLVNPALPAGTYTINKNDPAGNTYIPGNPGGNFISFNDAKAAMGCGIYGGHVIFNVVANTGPYNEQLVLDSIPGVTDTSTITFNGNGNTIKLTASTSSERAVIKLRGTDHIIFDSLVIDATASGTYGYGVQLVNNADSNTFRKCTILANASSTSTNYAGVVINASETSATATGNTYCDGNTFDQNTISGGYYGVTLMGGTATATYIKNNSFTNNTISEFYNYGFYIGGTYNTLIEGNTFSRPTRTSTPTGSIYGIYATSAISNRLSISKNRFTNFFGGVANSTTDFYGIFHNSVDATAGSEVMVTNNLIYGINSKGAAYGFYNSGSNNVFYYHNTVSFDDATSTTTKTTTGLYQTTAATGIFFKNNIVTIQRGGTGTKYGVYMNQTLNTEIEASNNDYYISGSNAYVGYRTGNQATLANWQTASGQDDNSFSLNPLYTDTASGNFKPQLVAIDNKGINLDIATDIENVTRSTTTPDLGAYEFIPTTCSAPVAGNALAIPNTGVCLEMPLHLTVQNHSTLGSITFQWQYSPDGVSNWTNIGPLQYFPDFDTLTTINSYYRAAVTCETTTVYTDVAHITLNPLLLAGTYTIDTTQATGGANFHSFQDAVNAMMCGISGPVVFNVAPGVYTEQINIPYIRNTSAVNTVTFQSANGIASSVSLQYNASSAANYTLRLDSTRYFTFRNMSFVAGDATYGRAVELRNNASQINFLHNIITVPAGTAIGTNAVGIYADAFKGMNINLTGNTISGGSRGIHFTGISSANLASAGHVIDSNSVAESYQYGIYTENTRKLNIRGNSVSFTVPTAVNAAGIYANYADTALRLTGNTVSMKNNSATAAYGISVMNSRSLKSDSSIVANNQFVAESGNTGIIYGLTIIGSKGVNVVNNVASINNTGTAAYGLYSLDNTDFINYYNNTVNIESAAANSYAGYFSQSAVGTINVFNNIFSNRGGGKALYVNNPSYFTADYNMLYTTGGTLVQVNTGTVLNFANLKSWTNTWNWDEYSIAYPPAFVSATDLRPDVTKPDVWAMHGRGTQIPGNSYDFNNQKRPETLTAGVPDLGAYEFYPTAMPTVLTSTPSVPVANSTQTFTYGTDTVMKITWGASAPPSVEVRRFSGVVPSGLQPTQDSMFFYTKVDIPGGANYNYAAQLYYINPWQGSIPQQYMIGLGRTTPSNAWVVGQNSKVDIGKKEISQDAIIYLDRFTGLVNSFSQPDTNDSTSNRGKDFWVGYQRTNGFGTTPTSAGSQDMVIYMGAGDQEANVTITIEGTSGTPWVRTYKVPANSTVTSAIIPKSGINDARLFWQGLHLRKGIHITSDVPIVAYAHIYETANSGATMLMPSTSWGYEYYTLSAKQHYSSDSYAAFHVVAQHDSTWVEINPAAPTRDGWVPNGGTQPNGSYLVKLNRGDVYQVLGAIQSGSEGYDLTGSYVKSIAGPTGCYPIAVFSGSTRTEYGCDNTIGSSGDLILQQIFPYQAWGTTYLVAPPSNNTSAGPSDTTNMTTLFRVLVKDPNTIVKLNGMPLPQASLVNSKYYQFESSSPNGDYIESNKPVLVAQYMASAGYCARTSGDGDPEMFYISPLEQAIKKTQFYRNNKTAINENFITLVIPTEGLQTLRIDGINYQAYPANQRAVITHLYNGYSIVTKKWTAGAGSSTVESDYPFTGIVYGLGSVESYGYNLGTLVKNLNNLSNINTTYNTGTTPTGYTCSGAPFQITAYLPLVPDSIRFNITAVSGLTPATNVTIKNPTPTSTTEVNGMQYYTFTLPQSFTLGSAGNFTVPIEYWSQEIESCDKKKDGSVILQVLPKPNTDFQAIYANALAAGCEGETVSLKGDLITSNGIALSQWKWSFAPGGSLTNADGQNQALSYPTAGTYNVKLSGITADGCVSDTTKAITLNAKPVVTLAQNTIGLCSGSNATLAVSNPGSGVVYNWYTAATGGTLLGTGATYIMNNVTPPVSAWAEAISNGCVSIARKEVKLTQLSPLAQPTVTVTGSTATSVTFTWAAVTGATAYEVSEDGGTTWKTPSSGVAGLTHTVAGIATMQQGTLKVRAKNAYACQTSESPVVTGCTDGAATVSNPTPSICPGSTATFNVQNPVAGLTYRWYTAASGGTAIATGTSYTTPSINTTTTYFVEQASATCTSITRTAVTVTALPPLAPATVTVVSKEVNSVTFGWNAVSGAASYLVSVGGAAWITPSSGATGLTHQVTGLRPLDTVSIRVQAIGTISCQTSTTGAVTGRSLPDEIYIPNSFSPNGDGNNDQLSVYGYTIKEMTFMVFNQWGEKIFETKTQNQGWDGTYKGKAQPSGVYIYVSKFILKDGSTVERRGTINLVR